VVSEQREPWWKVNCIFDPDGGGSDFSYTVGLAARGLPELHLWARPTLGDDPGADWHFSLRDTCGLLNQAAWRLVDGSLAVGDTWGDSYDEGYVTARFIVGDLVPAEDVDAYEAGDAAVLPIRWELVRPAIGVPRELTPVERAAAQAEYDDLVARLSPDESAPAGWELPTEPSWDADQRFGPRTPMVLARAAQIRQAGPDEIIDALERAIITDTVRRFGYPHVVARAAARGPGRTWALERVESEASDLFEDFGVTWGGEQCNAVRAWTAIGGVPATEDEWARTRDCLIEALETCLVVEASADLLPGPIVTWGQGVVRTSIGRQGVPPDDRWACSESVASAVREVVSATPIIDLVAAAVAWSERCREPDCWPVEAWLWTGANYPPMVFDHLDPAELLQARALLADHRQPLIVLQHWTAALATILAERLVVGEEAVAAFLACASGVPGLAELVNTPLVAEQDR
jgi:hypothetical protein